MEPHHRPGHPDDRHRYDDGRRYDDRHGVHGHHDGGREFHGPSHAPPHIPQLMPAPALGGLHPPLFTRNYRGSRGGVGRGGVSGGRDADGGRGWGRGRGDGGYGGGGGPSGSRGPDADPAALERARARALVGRDVLFSKHRRFACDFDLPVPDELFAGPEPAVLSPGETH